MPHMLMKIAFGIAAFAALSMQPAVADDLGAEVRLEVVEQIPLPEGVEMKPRLVEEQDGVFRRPRRR